MTAKFRRSADTYQFDTEAICVPLVSSTGHGNAAIHRLHYQSGKFALANIMVALVPKNNEQCLPKYLFYLLQSSKDYTLVPLMKGTSNVSLKIKDIAEVKVYLPSLAEQIAIVNKIDLELAQVNQVKILREEIMNSAQAMLKSAFNQVVKDATYKPLIEVAPIHRRPVKLSLNEEYPEIGTRSFGKGTFHKPSLSGLELPEWQKLYWIHSGDLIFNLRKAWEGSIASAGDDVHMKVASHNSYITCKPIKNVTNAEFLSFYFLSNEGMGQIQDATRGSADRNRVISMGRIKQFKVPLPSYSKQLKFSLLQKKVAEIKSAQQESEIELEALIPSILDKAFKD